jgi:hypothetical protein
MLDSECNKSALTVTHSLHVQAVRLLAAAVKSALILHLLAAGRDDANTQTVDCTSRVRKESVLTAAVETIAPLLQCSKAVIAHYGERGVPVDCTYNSVQVGVGLRLRDAMRSHGLDSATTTQHDQRRTEPGGSGDGRRAAYVHCSCGLLLVDLQASL